MASDPRSDEIAAAAATDVEVTATSVVRCARDLVGVPYTHHGRTVRGGLDCAGIVLYIAESLRLLIPRPPTDYGRAIRLGYVTDQMSRYFDLVAKVRAMPGMVIVIQTKKTAVHLAILETMRHLIESSNEPNVMCVVRKPVDWGSVRCAYAYRGVTY